ncbi:hypothetical protein DEJ25_09075 [Curtobacterium sp. MCPF17_011]|uniref:sensor histidine kinase n=1 Tax=Curtobacterium sp. MCPF17_011 TaxID=2175652 RepID=UPI000DA96341|nr:sensor histidine kinase [Curtobacterium sp. MCPF17_011]PZF11984.1 hypothetical protein DEJ25_09075 [Curtobacterium sp. MCPF17_011]
MTNRPQPYVSEWQSAPRRAWYLITALPVDLVGFVVVVPLLCLGLGLSIVWVGLPLLAQTVRLGGLLGTVARRRAAQVGSVPSPPDWTIGTASPRGGTATGPWLRITAPLGDTRNWAYTAHTLATFPLAVATWVATVAWGATAIGAVTFPAWGGLVTQQDDVWLARVAAGIGDSGQWTGLVVRPVVMVLWGLALVVTFPLVLHVLTAAHLRLAALLLGERENARLLRGAQRAESGRRAALLAEDASLRRLERDIHDGPQQQLLRLQYDLAIALRRLPDDTPAAQRLVAESLERAKAVLETIRNLSRGLAPPILQDRGLAAAIRSLADDSVVPTTAEVRLDDAGPGLGAIERSAYAILSELVTNVAKHADARAVELRAVAGSDGNLELEVRDDGHGGALMDEGHGLSGLRARVEGLQGALSISSPPGGPTKVLVTIPIPQDADPDETPTLAS